MFILTEDVPDLVVWACVFPTVGQDLLINIIWTPLLEKSILAQQLFTVSIKSMSTGRV